MKRPEDFFCYDLPSKPQPHIGKILVTGASGYIGGRLVPELLERGYSVSIMVRTSVNHFAGKWKNVEVITADAMKPETLKAAFKGVNTIYYLIHSLLLGPEEARSTDICAANNIRLAAEEMGVKRIIYLGALGDVKTHLSEHLQSRIEVARCLQSRAYKTTVLRAPIIIGSGSASFEIIKDVTGNLPVIFMSKWKKTKCQPIGIRDVIKYLVGALEIPETAGKSFDIGGIDILTYQEMIMIMSKVLGKNKYIIPVPISNIPIYSYLASFFTKVPAPLVRILFESLKNDVICGENEIRNFLPFTPLKYEEALRRALFREQNDTIDTRWTDTYPLNHAIALRLSELKYPPRFTITYSILTKKEASALFKSFCKIGGKEGWFNNNWMWRIRGMIDRILLGVGSSRGRKNEANLQINDVIDFWRVEALEIERKLLLRAEMKIPGKAWLEFKIEPREKLEKLSITAYYDTNSLFGRIYWYAFFPFHSIIFTGLLKQIEKRS